MKSRKEELIEKVACLAKTVPEPDAWPSSLGEAEYMIMHSMYYINIRHLKEYLIGPKPNFMVESPYTDPKTGLTEDRWYMPINGPGGKYYQEMLDQLKKHGFIPTNSTLDDYNFLFDRIRE